MKPMRAERIVDTVFCLVILAFVAMASGYNRTARLAPMLVGLVGLALGLVQVVKGFVAARGQGGTMGDSPGSEGRVREKESKQGDAEGVIVKSRRETAMFAWVGVFVLLMFLGGLLVSIPLFLLLFLKWVARENWKVSILVSAVTWLMLYVTFELFLRVPLYSGIIYESLRG